MAYYALLDENNVVIQVLTGNHEDDPRLPDGVDSWEQFYLNQNPEASDCKRTSYNTYGGDQHKLGGTPFRGITAGVGYTYEPDIDKFKPNKPFDQPDAVWDEDKWMWV